jgi:hypothetical protein
MQSLLQELQALEVELHHPGVCSSRGRLEQLLHPGFHEVGRSGTRYDRETVIRFLSTRESAPAVEPSEFSVVSLAPDVALLTYRSAQREAGGTLVNHTYRASIWVRDGEGWCMRYHQGTPAAEPG